MNKLILNPKKKLVMCNGEGNHIFKLDQTNSDFFFENDQNQKNLNPKNWPQNRTGGSINNNNDDNNYIYIYKTTKSLFFRTAMSFCFWVTSLP